MNARPAKILRVIFSAACARADRLRFEYLQRDVRKSAFARARDVKFNNLPELIRGLRSTKRILFTIFFMYFYIIPNFNRKSKFASEKYFQYYISFHYIKKKKLGLMHIPSTMCPRKMGRVQEDKFVEDSA